MRDTLDLLFIYILLLYNCTLIDFIFFALLRSIYNGGEERKVKENDSVSDHKTTDCLILTQRYTLKKINKKCYREFYYNAKTNLACVSETFIIKLLYNQSIHFLAWLYWSY